MQASSAGERQQGGSGGHSFRSWRAALKVRKAFAISLGRSVIPTVLRPEKRLDQTALRNPQRKMHCCLQRVHRHRHSRQHPRMQSSGVVVVKVVKSCSSFHTSSEDRDTPCGLFAIKVEKRIAKEFGVQGHWCWNAGLYSRSRHPPRQRLIHSGRSWDPK